MKEWNEKTEFKAKYWNYYQHIEEKHNTNHKYEF
jgi:hypothetical protein